MHPQLFQIASLRFHAYPTMLALAFLVCTLLAEREGRLLKRPVYIPPQGAVWVLLGALFGARVFCIIQYWGIEYLWRAIFLWERGYVFYGGLIGGFVAGTIYCYVIDNFDFRIVDVCVPYLALGQGMTRLGCFMNGCCWGDVCDVPWGVQFPKNSYAYDQQVTDGLLASTAELSLPVHPSQLYMAAGLVIICLILRYRVKSSPFTLAIALQYMFFYGALRYTVESFRGDSARSIFGLTVSQTISLSMVITAVILFPILTQWARKKGAPTEEPPEPEPEPDAPEGA